MGRVSKIPARLLGPIFYMKLSALKYVFVFLSAAAPAGQKSTKIWLKNGKYSSRIVFSQSL